MSDSKRRTGRPVDPNSLKARSAALFAQLKSDGKTGKEIKQAFQDTLGVTAGTAQVYYHYANKLYVQSLETKTVHASFDHDLNESVVESVSPEIENSINQSISEPEPVFSCFGFPDDEQALATA